ncbi:hypothetical protein QJS66_17435 [Kocuria rhizophila]|nr:hypothetical protein QJS66_17435 [Kocuria rhizophila]
MSVRPWRRCAGAESAGSRATLRAPGGPAGPAASRAAHRTPRPEVSSRTPSQRSAPTGLGRPGGAGPGCGSQLHDRGR